MTSASLCHSNTKVDGRNEREAAQIGNHVYIAARHGESSVRFQVYGLQA
jgi:hypothetical protein